MAIEDFITLPLKVANDLLAQPLQTKADPDAYADEVDKATFEKNVPNFFAQAAAQIAEAQRISQQQQQIAAEYVAPQIVQAEEGDFDQTAVLRAEQAQAQAPIRSALAQAQGDPTIPITAGPGAPSGPGYNPLLEETLTPQIKKTVVGDALGFLKDKAKEAITPVGKAIDYAGRAAGAGVGALPDWLPGEEDKIALALENLPELGTAAKRGFGKGFEEQHGVALSPETAKSAVFAELRNEANFVSMWSDKILTDKTLDPLLHAFLPEVIADRAVQGVGFAAQIVPWAVLGIIGGVPAGVAMTATFATLAAEDSVNLVGAYTRGQIDGKTLALAIGLNSIDMLDPWTGHILGRAMKGFRNKAAVVEAMQAIEAVEGKPPAALVGADEQRMNDIAEVLIAKAEARTMSDEELKRFAQREGVARTQEELAIDRGEIGPNEPMPGAGTPLESVPATQGQVANLDPEEYVTVYHGSGAPIEGAFRKGSFVTTDLLAAHKYAEVDARIRAATGDTSEPTVHSYKVKAKDLADVPDDATTLGSPFIIRRDLTDADLVSSTTPGVKSSKDAPAPEPDVRPEDDAPELDVSKPFKDLSHDEAVAAAKALGYDLDAILDAEDAAEAFHFQQEYNDRRGRRVDVESGEVTTPGDAPAPKDEGWITDTFDKVPRRLVSKNQWAKLYEKEDGTFEVFDSRWADAKTGLTSGTGIGAVKSFDNMDDAVTAMEDYARKGMKPFKEKEKAFQADAKKLLEDQAAVDEAQTEVTKTTVERQAEDVAAKAQPELTPEEEARQALRRGQRGATEAQEVVRAEQTYRQMVDDTVGEQGGATYDIKTGEPVPYKDFFVGGFAPSKEVPADAFGPQDLADYVKENFDDAFSKEDVHIGTELVEKDGKQFVNIDAVKNLDDEAAALAAGKANGEERIWDANNNRAVEVPGVKQTAKSVNETVTIDEQNMLRDDSPTKKFPEPKSGEVGAVGGRAVAAPALPSWVRLRETPKHGVESQGWKNVAATEWESIPGKESGWEASVVLEGKKPLGEKQPWYEAHIWVRNLERFPDMENGVIASRFLKDVGYGNGADRLLGRVQLAQRWAQDGTIGNTLEKASERLGSLNDYKTGVIEAQVVTRKTKPKVSKGERGSLDLSRGGGRVGRDAAESKIAKRLAGEPLTLENATVAEMSQLPDSTLLASNKVSQRIRGKIQVSKQPYTLGDWRQGKALNMNRQVKEAIQTVRDSSDTSSNRQFRGEDMLDGYVTEAYATREEARAAVLEHFITHDPRVVAKSRFRRVVTEPGRESPAIQPLKPRVTVKPKVDPGERGSFDFKKIFNDAEENQTSRFAEMVNAGVFEKNPTPEYLAALPTKKTPMVGDIVPSLTHVIDYADPDDINAIQPYIDELKRRGSTPQPPEFHAVQRTAAQMDEAVERHREWRRENPDAPTSEYIGVHPIEAKDAYGKAMVEWEAHMRDAQKEREAAQDLLDQWEEKRIEQYQQFRSESGRPITAVKPTMSQRYFELRSAYEDLVNIAAPEKVQAAFDRLQDFLRGGEEGVLRIAVAGKSVSDWMVNTVAPAVERIVRAIVRAGRVFNANEVGAIFRKGSIPKFTSLTSADLLDFGAAQRWLNPEQSVTDWAQNMAIRVGGNSALWASKYGEVTKHVEKMYGLLGEGKQGVTAEGVRFGRESGPANYQRLKELFDAGRKLKQGDATFDMAKWYENFWDVMVDNFGDDAEMMTRFMAMSQANASPAAGTSLAMRAYIQWKLGDPISRMGSKTIRQKMESFLMGALPEGDKIFPFWEALRFKGARGKNAVAVDRWIIGALGGRSMGSGMLVGNLQGNQRFIRFSQAVIQSAAAEAGVSPRAFQAAVWGGFRKEWDDALKAAGQKPLGGDNAFFEDLLVRKMQEYSLRSPKDFKLNTKNLQASMFEGAEGAEIELWQKRLAEDIAKKIEGVNPKQAEILQRKLEYMEWNSKIAAARLLDTGEMPKHITTPEVRAQVEQAAEAARTSFAQRIAMADNATLEKLTDIPEWQKREITKELDIRERSNEQVKAAWTALTKDEKKRMNLLGWAAIPKDPTAYAKTQAALRELDAITTESQMLRWLKRPANRNIVGDPAVFTGRATKLGDTYETSRGTVQRTTPSSFWEPRSFYENRLVLNVDKVKTELRRRFPDDAPELRRNVGESVGLGTLDGEELGKCGIDAAKKLF